MKEADAAYIAALLDSIGTIKIESSDRNSKVCSLYVWITNKDYKLMEFLQRAGAFIVRLGSGKYRAKWKDERAGILLRSIIPHSRIKREQIIVGLDFVRDLPKRAKDEKFHLPYLLRLKLLKSEE